MNNQNAPFKRELRYLLFKISDVNRYLSSSERDLLRAMADKIYQARTMDNRGPLEAVVIESDWSCFDKAWELVELEHKKAVAENS